MTKYDTCHTCRGRGDMPTSEPAGFNAAYALWVMCGTCKGFGVVAVGTYGCGECLDSGINVYDLDFDPANPHPCEHCTITTPEPTPPAPETITVAGHTIHAPGFTADSFDRAIQRAHNDGIYLEATDRRDMVLAVNPITGATYTVSRYTCSCRAGQQGTPCKHIAMAVFEADIMHQLPQPDSVVAA